MELPKRYEPKIAEPKWQKYWKERQIYKFNDKDTKNIYSIDTPPPYASADHLHVGHGMHYTQFEFVARFMRMRGKNVFFPMGFDDNGLPTERFVEKKHKINKSKTSRKEFTKLCLEATEKAGKTYHNLFTELGFSIDWDLLYHTIDERAQRVSQKSFIDLFHKGRLERIDYPTTWCTTCQTTIAQADLESSEQPSHFSDINFSCGDKKLTISTTRPEMLPACVALFHHPDDDRYKNLKGKFAVVPLFNYEVPILSDEAVDKEKGTGLMMVCTFGDKEDVEKWNKYHLPLRVIFTEHGKMNELAGKYEKLKIKDARKAIIEDLKSTGNLINQKEISHAVNVHERCGTEIEFLKKQQWQIKILDKKQELIEMGNKVNWHPEHMRMRYEHWVKNLQWNWGISRQRYYGVPFPVWYCNDCGSVVLAKEEDLPVDPREDSPKNSCACGSQNLVPEMDVMDTWMTSSVTPQINANWGAQNERQDFLPMSLHPQAHDIIRTWAFYTIVKAFYHNHDIPWKDIMISGHGQDQHGHKMSKSKGNFVVAQDVIQKYSADAFRYWSATVKLGEDLPYQEKDVLTGQKFINKLWNASKFTISHLEDYKEGKIIEVFDQWLMSKLHKIIELSIATFEKFEYSRTKSEVEKFFWQIFCDQYLEIVKDRLYNPDQRGKGSRISAQNSLSKTLLAVLKMMAPIMPHITEDIYQVYFAEKEDKKSIHISNWPHYQEELVNEEAEQIGDMGVDIINAIRKYKSEQQLSMKEEFNRLILVSEKENFMENVKKIEEDLKAVLHVKEIIFAGETTLVTEKFGVKVGLEF